MSVTPVEGTLPTTATSPTLGLPASTDGAASEDKEMFLQLLVAQMRYQDPMNPTDSSEFLAQSAQFTALEKMQVVADQTLQLVNLQVAFGASSLVGRSVTFGREDGSVGSGAVESVRFESTGPVLLVAGEEVSLAAVQTVAQGSADTVTPPASDPATNG
jgi:flagellar basal-body rod modification protein FlgD